LNRHCARLRHSQRGGAKPQKDTKYVYLNRHVIAEVEVAK
jgi:hypothetical protein